MLAGYTTLVAQMKDVLKDLEDEKYERVMVNSSEKDKLENIKTKLSMKQGRIVEDNFIKFEDVPITAPNGDVLVEKINFEIKPGMNCIVTGPNGCGKSSLFRILGNLWPMFGGVLTRPSLDKVFYIPQVKSLKIGF